MTEKAAGGKTFQLVGNDISDGYHTFDELYEHRIALFVALMKSHRDISWLSHKHADGSMFKGWFIAGMDLPTGRVSYHLPVEWCSELDDIAILETAPEWDGHTPSDVIKRLSAWEPARFESGQVDDARADDFFVNMKPFREAQALHQEIVILELAVCESATDFFAYEATAVPELCRPALLSVLRERVKALVEARKQFTTFTAAR